MPEPKERTVLERGIEFATTVFAIVGFGVILIAAVAYGIEHTTSPATSVVASIPTPVITPAQSYPTVMTYTVLSTTTSAGRFQIYTTDGKILYCMDYYDYNLHNPQDTYTAMVTGREGEAYLISTPQVIAYHSDPYDQYPQYYTYGGRYYQTNGRTVDQVTWKQAAGERVINGKPPRYYRR